MRGSMPAYFLAGLVLLLSGCSNQTAQNSEINVSESHNSESVTMEEQNEEAEIIVGVTSYSAEVPNNITIGFLVSEDILGSEIETFYFGGGRKTAFCFQSELEEVTYE